MSRLSHLSLRLPQNLTRAIRSTTVSSTQAMTPSGRKTTGPSKAFSIDSDVRLICPRTAGYLRAMIPSAEQLKSMDRPELQSLCDVLGLRAAHLNAAAMREIIELLRSGPARDDGAQICIHKKISTTWEVKTVSAGKDII